MKMNSILKPLRLKNTVTIGLSMLLLFLTSGFKKELKPTVTMQSDYVKAYVYFELINNLGRPFDQEAYERIDGGWKIISRDKKEIYLRPRKVKKADVSIRIELKNGICTAVHFKSDRFNLLDRDVNFSKVVAKRSHVFIKDFKRDFYHVHSGKYRHVVYNGLTYKTSKEVRYLNFNQYNLIPSKQTKGIPSNENIELFIQESRHWLYNHKVYNTHVYLTIDGQNKSLKKKKRELNL